jgi:hypothetical protein
MTSSFAGQGVVVTGAVGGDVSRRADVRHAVGACIEHAGQTIVLDGGQTLGIPLDGVQVDVPGGTGNAP